MNKKRKEISHGPSVFADMIVGPQEETMDILNEEQIRKACDGVKEFTVKYPTSKAIARAQYDHMVEHGWKSPEEATNLEGLQQQVEGWNREKLPGAPSYLALIKVQEELGELAAHFIGRLEHRVGKPEEDHQAGIEDAVADIIISTVVFCCREGIDLGAAVEKAWGVVKERNIIVRKGEPPQSATRRTASVGGRE